MREARDAGDLVYVLEPSEAPVGVRHRVDPDGVVEIEDHRRAEVREVLAPLVEEEEGLALHEDDVGAARQTDGATGQRLEGDAALGEGRHRPVELARFGGRERSRVVDLDAGRAQVGLEGLEAVALAGGSIAPVNAQEKEPHVSCALVPRLR